MDLKGGGVEVRGADKRVCGVLGKVGLRGTITDLDEGASFTFVLLVSGDGCRYCCKTSRNCHSISLQYLLKELSADSFLVSAHRPRSFPTDQFRTDAKCTDDMVVIAGWECGGRKRRWFALEIFPTDAPYLFKPGKGAQWASTSAELLASLAALFLFG